jgi:hypothetical protein
MVFKPFSGLVFAERVLVLDPSFLLVVLALKYYTGSKVLAVQRLTFFFAFSLSLFLIPDLLPGLIQALCYFNPTLKNSTQIPFHLPSPHLLYKFLILEVQNSSFC